MHVVVVGCGRVGSELAVELENNGHTVAVIDKTREAFSHLPERWSGRAVLGYGFDRDHLEQAGIAEAGALAAVTRGDNTNIVSSRIAKEHFGVQNVVARIYDPRRALIFERLGIPTVASVTWATDQAFRRLFPEQSHTDWVDATGALSLREYSLPDGLVGRPYDGLLLHKSLRLIGIRRNGEVTIPTPGLLSQEGDILHLAILSDDNKDIDAEVSNAFGGSA